MRASDKYARIFGKMTSLSEPISWTTGLSNMFEWLAWGTHNVLGITKTDYRKKLITWSHEAAVSGNTLDETIRQVTKKADAEIRQSEKPSRDDKPEYRLATPREALRRAKYFSEDYLNKEFDIFWTLVSDRYLDSYYSQFANLKPGGYWSTHGNSGLFSNSTGISEMQMDNLSYNPTEKLLIANELKLGGRKNPDQILKYGLLFRLLMERNFIAKDSRFLLLFINDQIENHDWQEQIRQEINHCRNSPKSTAKKALGKDGLDIVHVCQYQETTWENLLQFNIKYLKSLELPLQQVEHRLITGFNDTLKSKYFLRASLKD